MTGQEQSYIHNYKYICYTIAVKTSKIEERIVVTTFTEAATVIRNTIKNKYPQIDRAFIFGSFADGVQTTESDLDILVELNASMGLKFITMIQDIEQEATIK